jgi:hypothetical protein
VVLVVVVASTLSLVVLALQVKVLLEEALGHLARHSELVAAVAQALSVVIRLAEEPLVLVVLELYQPLQALP